MQVTILCVGKLKEKYLKEGIKEYLKRLKSYAKVQVIEVADEPDTGSIEQIKEREGERLIKKWPNQAYMFALRLDGKLYDSVELAQTIDQLQTRGHSHFGFVIGGSNGLSDTVLSMCQGSLAFGRLTYPHQLMRLMLIEQIYRIERINAGHSYHK
ncbi:23S rRNA (pseudouridine(1915)-N(3))-methyltransferase RlmH [Atopobacter phocae]|uniref:23S rRNA (pseudouridine(1915)-N(3))-methyltransferase RlmH n=1 Tax=Atopobacter phocae TaxID=136492 RepID=UPI0004725118|nr:23S rRNA (pseudouridine(1915)-N(3))-methyltransferase RlmH [Atopobacter phocae]